MLGNPRKISDHSSVVLGSYAFVYVEVIPVVPSSSSSSSSSSAVSSLKHVSMSASFAKLKLIELSNPWQEGDGNSLCVRWQQECLEKIGSFESSTKQEQINPMQQGILFVPHQQQSPDFDDTNKNPKFPLIFFPSENPVEVDMIPCLVIGYAIRRQPQMHPASATLTSGTGSIRNNCQEETRISNGMVTHGTFVHILPATMENGNNPQYTTLTHPTGEIPASSLRSELLEDMRYHHSQSTIKELHLRMSLLMSKPVCIGTTEAALTMKTRQEKRRTALESKMKQQWFRANRDVHPCDQDLRGKGKIMPSSQLPDLFRGGALLVHCPNHGAGKTTLVQFVAEQQLGCDIVHVLQPGPFFAKYGSSTDVALESVLHSIVLRAAVRCASVCVVLDHFDAWMPPALSGKTCRGDAAVPVLNAIESYFARLLLSLRSRQEFPYPHSNQLYNVAGGKIGYVLPVRLCLVGVVTCPDNGWRQKGINTAGILDALPMSLYRLPSLDSATRITACMRAFNQRNILLSDEAKQRLHSLALATVWYRGRLFAALARALEEILKQKNTSYETEIDATQLESAFVSVGSHASDGVSLSIQTTVDNLPAQGDSGINRDDPFGFVGGSHDAKRCLEDALALDSVKRVALDRLGVSPPTGILLYGPPGNGKTLLAKAVARVVGGGVGNAAGGAFISLNSSEIVQAEIGTSEKLIVSAFLAARENAPSVIFVDEFQALFTERSGSGSSKLSSTLLQCMDDIKQWRNAVRAKNLGDGISPVKEDIVVLAATNTIWMIDNAFLRPGRFDRLVHVGLPTFAERESILGIHMKNMRLGGSKDAVAYYSANIAERTNGFSGAELAALCRAAAVRCLHEGGSLVTEKHFVDAINDNVAASSNTELVRRNLNWSH